LAAADEIVVVCESGVLYTLIAALDEALVEPVAAGVEPELPGDVEVVPPVDGVDVDPEADGVVPVAAGVEPVAEGVVPVATGVEPELPGVAGVETTTGEVTTEDFTGVVARVTRVAVFLTTAGVTLVVAAALVALPPPELPPEELAVH
jgi:hypothetical protein